MKFLDELEKRHLANLTRPEFTRAVRALSVRYVERRGQLPDRSPLDSAGKRAAFALFYAPLHMLITQAAVEQFAGGLRLSRLIDLGCGTGVCSAGWALTVDGVRPAIDGYDLHPWVLEEARWNWRTLGLHGRAHRLDAVTALERLAKGRSRLDDTGIIAGWAINELGAPARARLRELCGDVVTRGASLMILEPLARGIAPWWNTWVDAFAPSGAVADDFKPDTSLPPPLDDYARAAGFSRQPPGARVLFVPGRSAAP